MQKTLPISASLSSFSSRFVKRLIPVKSLAIVAMLLLSAIGARAQSDECTGATPTLTQNATCSNTAYNIANPSGFGSALANPTCGTFNRDFYYKFTANATQSFIDVTSNRQAGIAVYTGACGSLTEVACVVPVAANASLSLTTTIGTQYYIRIGRTNNNTDNGMSGNICVYSTPSYCTSSSSNTTANGQITRVLFTGVTTINQTSPASPCNAYQNFTADIATVSPGSTYPIAVTTVQACDGSFSYSLRAYIDWNRDGNLGNDGIAFAPAAQNVNGTFSGNITVPAGASTAGSLRMRVILNYNTFAAGETECGTYDYGETEDYTINVCGAANGVTISSTQTICSGGTAALSISGYAGGSTFQWQSSPDNVTWTNVAGATSATYTTAALASDKYYRVNITASGCTAATGSVLVHIFSAPNAGADQSACVGGSVSLAGTQDASATSCAWTVVSGPGAGTFSPSNTPVTTFTPTAVGTYTLRLTSNFGGCPRTDDVIVTATAFTVSISPASATICSGGSTALTATPSMCFSGAYSVTKSNTGSYPILDNSSASGANYNSWDGSTSTAKMGVSPIDFTGLCMSTVYTITLNMSVTEPNLCELKAYLQAPSGCGTKLLFGSNEVPPAYVVSECAAANGVANMTNINFANGGPQIFGGTTPVNGNTYGPGGTNTSGTNQAPGGSGACTAASYVANFNCITGCNPAGVWNLKMSDMGFDGLDGSIDNWSMTISGTNGIKSYAWSPAAGLSSTTIANPTATPTITTTYTVTITDYGCNTTSASVVITVVPAITSVPTASPAAICPGNSSTINAVAGGGNGTYSYSWTSSPAGFTSTAASASVSPIVNTTYTVTVTSGGCTKTASVAVTITATPVAPTAAGTTICSGTTATLTATAPGGTYNWYTVSTGGSSVGTGASYTTPTLTATTTYYVDANNGSCTGSRTSVVVTVSPAPSAAAAGPDQTICATTATLAATSPASGTGAWTVTAGGATVTTTGSPTSGVTGLTVGVNTFRWTISNAPCTATTDDITITRDAAPTTSAAGPDQSVCGLSTTLAGNTATTGTGTWTKISGPGTVTFGTVNSATSSATVSAYGIYVLQWTIANGTCPSSSSSVTVTYSQAPTTATAGPDQSVCGLVATLAGNTATIGAGTWTFVSGPGTITFSSATSATSTATASVAGTYVVQWSIANAPCAASTDQVTIIYSQTPTIANAGPDQNICGTTATLAGNAPAAGTGAWTVTAGSGTVTAPATNTSGVTGLSNGVNTFRWTISNGACPSNFDDVTINVSPASIAGTANTSATICSGSSVTLTLTGSTGTIQWQSSTTSNLGPWTNIAGATTASYNTGALAATTYYQAVVTSAPCAAATSNVITITVTPAVTPSITISASPAGTICAGTSVTFTAAPTNGGAGPAYQWKLNGSNAGTNSATYTNAALANGDQITCVLTSNAACASPLTATSNTITMTVSTPPTVSAAGADQSVCGLVATLAGNTATVGTGTWTTVSGPGTITYSAVNSATSTATASVAGTYVVQWSIANAPCPASTDQVQIIYSQTPTVSNAGPDQNICATTATLAGNTATTGTGAWTVTAGSGTVTTPATSNSGVTGLSIGVNTFRWTISSGACPPSIDDITINVSPAPVAGTASSSATICSGSSVTLTLAGSTGTIQWQSSTTSAAGPWANIAGATSASYTTGALAVTTYYQAVVSSGACPNVTSNVITITVNPNVVPSVTISAAPAGTICAGTSVTFTAAPTNGGAGPSYQWKKNSINVGTNSNTYTSTTLANGDVITCVLTSNAACASPLTATSNTITMTVSAAPSAAAAGADQTVCATTATLGGTAPAVGTGAWTVTAGGATVTTPGSPTSGVTGLTVGVNTFRWTVSNAPCTPSTDDITINVDAAPTTAAAGADQTVCGLVVTLAGNTATSGIGTWTKISGPGTVTFSNANLASSTATVSVVGTYILQWSITNGVCAPSTDQVQIIYNQAPTTSTAGADQSVCGLVATLAGNTATVGTGTWTTVSGLGTITYSNASSATSTATASVAGTYVLQWSIANAPCAASTDQVQIIFSQTPTVSNAGPDQSVCGNTATLAGNVPTTGTGTWTKTAGGGTITAPTTNNSGVTGLTGGVNTFRWTIINGACPPSIDDVTINVSPAPVAGTASANNLAVCSGSTVNLTLTGSTGLIQWQSSTTSNAGPWTNIAGATSATYTSGPLAATTYFQAVVSSAPCANVTSNVLTITISPTSVAGTAAATSTNICAGSTTTLSLSGNTGTIQWEKSTDGGTTWTAVAGATATPYTTPALTTTTQYRAIVTSGTCAPAISNVLIITVSPAPVAGTATASATAVCAGSTVTLTLTGSTGTIQWESSTTSAAGPFAAIVGATSATYTSGPITGTTYYRVTVSSGGCTAVTSNVLTITVSPASVAGAAAASSTTVCSGNTTTLTLTGNTGTIQWEQSTDGGITWANAAGASTVSPYTTPALTVTTQYRAKVTSGTCTAVYSNILTITVNPAPVAGTASATPNPVCTGSTVTLTLTGSSGTIQWETSTTSAAGPFTAVAGATGTTYVSGAITVTTYFRATVSSAGCPTSVSSNVLTITVSPASVAGNIAASANPICSGSTTTLTLTGNTGTIQWQTSSDNITFNNIAGATATTYTTPALTVTTYYRVVVTSGACTAVNSAPITITVNPGSVGGTATTDQTICSGSTANINLSGNTGTIQWEQSTDGGATWANATGASTSAGYTSPALATTTKYRAKVTSGTCVAAYSNVVTITVNPTSVGGTAAANQTICSGSTVSISLSGNTGAIQWQKSTDGGITWTDVAGATATPYTTAAITVTTQYRAKVTSGVCAAVYSTAITITVDPTSVAGTATADQTICSGATPASITLAGNTGTIQWEQSTDGGATWSNATGASTAATYSPGALVTTTKYRAKVKSGTCPSVNSNVITITVNPIDNPAFNYSSSSYCKAGTNPIANRTGGATGTFTGPVGIVFVNAGTGEINLSACTVGGPYTITFTTNGPCPATSTFNITITNSNIADFHYTGPYCVGATPNPLPVFDNGGTAGAFTSTAGLVFVSTATGEINLTTSTAGTYTITNTIASGGGCPTATFNTSVVINAKPVVTATPASQSICSGTQTNIALTSDIAGSSFNWAVNDPSATGSTAGSGTSIQQTLTNTGAVAVTTTYMVTPTGPAPSSCAGTKIDVVITVNPIPATPTPNSNSPLCEGSDLNLTSGAVAGATYAWSGPNSYTAIVQNPTIIAATTAASGVYSLIVTLNGCSSAAGTTPVTVNPIPAAPTVTSPVSYCQGAVASPLTATPQAGATLTWYTVSAGGVGSATAPTPSTASVGTTSYYVSQTQSGCEGPRAQINVVVNSKDNASFTYNSVYCRVGANPSANITGLAGGTFTATPAGLVFVSTSTGEIDLAASTANTYTITYTTNGPCPNTATASVELTDAPVADPTNNGPVCEGGSLTLSSAITGATYTWSGPNSFSSAAQSPTISPVTAAAAGTYTLTVQVGTCISAPKPTTVVINPIPAAPTVTSPVNVCKGAASPTLSATGSSLLWYTTAVGGVGSATAPTPSTASVGTTSYYVSQTVNTCESPRAQVDVVVKDKDDATFSYSSGTFCTISTPNPATATIATPGGTFSVTPAGLSLNTGTGDINLATSTPNSYTITYTTNGTCPNSSTFPLTITTSPKADFQYVNSPYCKSAGGFASPTYGAGASGGTFSVTPVGLIIDASGVIDIAASIVGCYTVTNTITLAGCGSDTKQTQICIVAPPTVSIAVTPSQTICQGATATFTATSNPAAGNPTYQWFINGALQGGQTASTFTTNALIDQDKVSCTMDFDNVCGTGRSTATSNQITMTIKAATAVSIDATALQVCLNEKDTVSVNPLGLAGMTYTWSSTGGTFTPITQEKQEVSWSNPVPSTKTVTLVATNSTGCQSTATISISITPATASTFNITAASNPICSTDSVLFTATGFSPAGSDVGSTFTWQKNGTSSATGVNMTQWKAGGLITGDSVYCIMTNNAKCAVTPSVSSSNGIKMIVNTAPTIAFTEKTSVCIGATDTIIYTGNGVAADTYTWDFDGATIVSTNWPNTVVTWNTAGTKTVKLISVKSSANGCTNSKSQQATVTVNSLPIIVLRDTLVCGSNPVTLKASGATSYSWSPATYLNQTTGSSVISTPLATTTYTVTGTDAKGCVGSNTMILSIQPLITYTLTGKDVTCNGKQDGTATVTSPGGAYTYLWSTAATTAGITGLSGGTYTVTVSDGTCSLSKNVIIKEPKALTASIITIPASPARICIGQSVTLTAKIDSTTGTQPYNFTWTAQAPGISPVPNTGISTSASPIITTTYIVTTTDANSCILTTSMEVKVNDSLRVTLTGPSSLCAKDSGLFIATAAGGNGVYTYTWTRNPGGSIGGNNSKLKTDIAQNTDIIVTLTDGCGSPQAQKKLSVEFRPIPVAQMKVRGDSVGCSPMLVKFASLVLPSQNVKYIWNYGDNRIDSTDVDSTSHVFEYQMQNQGKYRVIMSIRLIDNGCSGRDTTTVIAMEKPHADFSYTPKEISNANPRAQFTDLSYPLDNSMINKWYWTFGDGDKDSVQNPNHEYKGSGYNQVVLIITNSVGCKDTAMKALEVGEDYKLFIPDAFTPNGDGTNDTFIAKGIGIVKFDMYIYNRWGEEIFKTDNIEKGWDGTHYNDVGKSLEDVYVYKIVVFDYLHRKHEYVGRIMLLK